jgi:integrase
MNKHKSYWPDLVNPFNQSKVKPIDWPDVWQAIKRFFHARLIRQAGRHSWQLQVYVQKLPNGKWQRSYETVRGTKRQAESRLAELKVSLDKGTFKATANMTLVKHLDNWHKTYILAKTKPRTQEGVRSIINTHIKPYFGDFQLKQITWEVLNQYYSEKEKQLSKRTVYKHHRILSQSFKFAVKKNYMTSNPCDFADVPKPEDKQMRALTPDELKHLLEVAESYYHYPIIYTDVCTGLRQAEILGLRWRDINLDVPTISINQVLYKRNGIIRFDSPKTDYSRRCIELVPRLAAFLVEYKKARGDWYRHNNTSLTPDDLVFTNASGKPQDPSVLSHYFKKVADAAGLKGVRFHDLRHTFASLALLRGVNVKIISEMLGHSSVAFTMKTYAHVLKGMQKDAVKLMDGIIPVGKYSNAKITLISFKPA